MNITERRERDRLYYRQNKDAIILKRMKKYYAYKDKWYKGVVCWCCGRDFNIHYHHLDPSTKEFSISEKWWLPDYKVQLEIDKCLPLCANCHKMIHIMSIPPEYLTGEEDY